MAVSLTSISGDTDFPYAEGETARLLRQHDWSAAMLGSLHDWSPTLRAATGLILASPVPMAVIWGPDGIMLYNDAYATIAGACHPTLLGMSIKDAWPKLAAFNAHVITSVLAGKALRYRDRELVLTCGGAREKIWADLAYSPLRDAAGIPVAVLAIVTDTTARVLAEREVAAQHQRLRTMFDQAPGFIAILEGPDHVFSFVNQAYNRLMGSRNVVGRSVADSVPEAGSHGLLRALDTAYRTGKPYVVTDFKFAIADAAGGVEDHYLDFVYQPLRDVDGEICGIFAHGSDVSERVLAGEALRRSRMEYQRLNDALIMANNILSTPASKPGSAG
jgi:PAS domain S-box-containing protein